jgi:hypothetical protein
VLQHYFLRAGSALTAEIGLKNTISIHFFHYATVKEWRWLFGLQNNLDFKGIRLSVFSIGTQNISYRHDFLAKTGNSARFMVSNSRFNGLRDEADLEFVLTGYDQEWSIWEENDTSAIYCLNNLRHI